MSGRMLGPVWSPLRRVGIRLFPRRCPDCGNRLPGERPECPACGFGRSAPAGPQRTAALETDPACAGILGWLVPLEGGLAGELLEVRRRATVGAAEDNDLVVADPSISGRHAELVGSEAGFLLSDLASTNGTFVNGRRVESQILVDNDNLRLGRIHFKWKSLV